MEVPIKVLVHDAEEGGYWAEVPGLPGCYTQAETIEELRANLLDALKGWLGATQDEAIIRGPYEPGEVLTL